MKNSGWIIRHANPDDIPFIYATWLNSYRTDSDIGKSVKKSIYFKEYVKVLDSILAKDDTTVLVAVLPRNTAIILGYLVFQPSVIHYAFVKESFRKNNIAKSLLIDSAQHFNFFTHRTKKSEPIIKSKLTQLDYNPFLSGAL